MGTKRRAIGIVRVSKVGGREGEAFASPGQQRERIEQVCKRDGLRLTAVFDELDVSGGTPLEKRTGLRTAVETVEAGKAEVVLAAYLDRLCRSLDVQREVVTRVEHAGGEVFAVDVGQVTHGTATKKLSGTLLGAFAEYQRDTARERSGDAQRRAVARGVVPWPNIPAGYTRGGDGVLVPDPATAPVVAEAFAMRAAEATVKEVRAHLTANGVERSWHGVQAMLASRIYLGQLHFGEHHNLTAHEPIVDAEVWARAQRTEIRGPRAKSERLLARLDVLRCGSCGGRMSVGVQTQNGRKYPFYRCSPLGDCKSRMAVSATMAESEVVAAVREALADVEGRASAEDHARVAEQELAAAQEALDNAIRSLAGLAGEPVAVETLRTLTEARDGARERLDRVGGGPALTVSMSDWDELSLDARRALIRATVAQAVVGPGRGAGRIAVELHGQ